MVILAVDPFLRGHARRGEDLLQRRRQIARLGQVGKLLELVLPRRTLARAIVEGGVVGERPDGEIADHGAAGLEHQLARVGHAADDGIREVPLVADGDHLRLAALLRDEQHALLRLGEHDLVRRHAGLAARHCVEIELEAAAGARGHLDRRRGQARGAHVLDAHEAVGLEELEAGFQQELLEKGIADLDGGALRRALLVELGGGHRRPVDAVAAGARADVDDGIADAARRAAKDAVRLQDAEREGVHEAVAVVAVVERDLAAHGGNADAVAVARDARHDALEEARGLRVRRIAEAQRVQGGDRPRAHGEDVAQDAAHAGGRALVRLDVARVIVALHLERHREPVAHVHDAGVLSGPLQHARAGGRQVPEEAARGLVRAVLAPHRGEDAQLDEVRVAAERRADALVLIPGESVLLDDRRGDALGREGRHRVAHSSKTGHGQARPSPLRCRLAGGLLARGEAEA